MAPSSFLTLTLSFLYFTSGLAAKQACNTISQSISSSSQVFFPGSSQYNADIKHWTNSSTQQSACSVEPGTNADLGKILRILGYTRTPFAVKSGGHAINQGFSSTTGVTIALSRFTGVTYDAAQQSIAIGAGMIWDDVYAALDPQGVTALGARVTGIGVGGFILGGGIAYKSQQHGLAIDTVLSYDLVLPNGTFATITNTSHPDIFFGLKGGFNNFGIVTKFTLQAFPQADVWGGFVSYTVDKLTAFNQAIAKFQATNLEPKAQIIPYPQFAGGAPSLSVILYFDGAFAPGTTPPNFADFLAIPAASTDLSTRSLLSLVQSPPGFGLQNTRATFNTVSVTNFTENILNVISNDTFTLGAQFENDSEIIIAYVTEPYINVEKYATEAAYPHNTPRMILNAYYSWTDPTKDSAFLSASQASVQRIIDAALAEGQAGNQILYPNYCPANTPMSQMYGTNLQRLGQIRAAVDPFNVMGLTGGFKFGSPAPADPEASAAPPAAPAAPAPPAPPAPPASPAPSA